MTAIDSYTFGMMMMTLHAPYLGIRCCFLRVYTPPQIELEEERECRAVPLCLCCCSSSGLWWRSTLRLLLTSPSWERLCLTTALGELDNEDDHVVCHTDLDACCGGSLPDRGFWYFPNGDVLPGAGGAANNTIVLMRGPQVARLIRGTGPGDAPSGLYRCIIETVADNGPGSPSPGNGIGEILYVGVYSTGG